MRRVSHYFAKIRAKKLTVSFAYLFTGTLVYLSVSNCLFPTLFAIVPAGEKIHSNCQRIVMNSVHFCKFCSFKTSAKVQKFKQDFFALFYQVPCQRDGQTDVG